LYPLVVLCALPLALFTLVSDPMVQTFMARFAGSYLSQKFETEIKVDALKITPLLNLYLDGLLVRDHRQDTLIYASSLMADINKRDLRKKHLLINEMSISDASIGLFKYADDTLLNINQIIRRIDEKEDTVDSPGFSWTFMLTAVDLFNARFRYFNDTREHKPKGMDYANLDIAISALEISDIVIEKDTIDLTIHEFISWDRSGFMVEHLSGIFRLSHEFLIANDLKVITPNSDLSLDFSFNYSEWNDYIDFIQEVNIDATIGPSVLNLKDIGFFTVPLMAMDNELRIGGDFDGTVDNLKGKNFRFAFKEIWFDGDISLFGLPDVEETFVNLTIRGMEFAMADIKQFALPGKVRFLEIPPTLDYFGRIGVYGTFTGFFNDFVANGKFLTELGQFTTDVNLQPEESGEIKYEGELTATQFDIGKLLGLSDYVGSMNLEAYIDGQGVTEESAIIGMNGSVDSLEFMGNNFNQVLIAGIFGGKRFNGYVNIFDELVQLDFKGNIDFNREVPVVDFAADINDARLYDLNILKRDPSALFSSKIWCSFVGKDLDVIEGRLNIDSTFYTEGDQQIFMEHLTMLTLKEDQWRREISLRSDILDAELNGTYRFVDLYPSLLGSLDQFISLEYLGIERSNTASMPQDYSFELILDNADEILKVFLPELMLAPNTSVLGSFDSKSSDFTLTGKSDHIIYSGLRFNNWDLSMSSTPESVSLNNKFNRFIFKDAADEEDVELGLDKLILLASAGNDSLDFSLNWADPESVNINSGNISGSVIFADSSLRIGRIRETKVYIRDSLWTINKDNLIVLDSTSLELKNMLFAGGKQELLVDGKVSSKAADTMNMRFDNWQFSNFDLLVNNENLDVDGKIDGDLFFSALTGKLHFESNITIQDLILNKVKFGTARMNTSWEPKDKAILLDADVIYTGNVGTSKTLDVKGAYFPERTDKNFDVSISMENFKIKTFKPFVKDVFSHVSGVASGILRLDGTVAKPALTGKLKLMRTELGVGYINTRYSFADEIEFTSNSIDFNNITIYDSLGNTGVIGGKIKHNYLNDFYVDLGITADNLICLNTNKYQNEIFYGDAFGSGLVEIKGPFHDISLDVKATTKKGTDVFIPLGSTANIAQHDYITFYDPEQDTLALPSKHAPQDDTGLNLYLDLDVTNDSEIQLFLPDRMGDINSRGTGNLKMEISPPGDFSIKGDYVISNGNFLFQIQNIIRKRFDVLEGGRITFSGDPYNADLNIRGLYRLKTTLSGLSTTLDALYAGERVFVDCIIGLKGKLADPEIDFSIRFPNIETEARHNIYAVLDTNDQGAMNQQMISLLILGSFSYTSGAGNLGASSFNLISNQLSNWLSQISRDFDVGINYIPGDQINEQEIEVALSTQLFNDRLLIDGNVGVGGQNATTSSQNASNIVGDVNIEYKLRRDGRIRLRAFNRSNNIYTFENIAPYTQGVGIFYRKEFNRFDDLFGFLRKKKQAPDE